MAAPLRLPKGLNGRQRQPFRHPAARFAHDGVLVAREESPVMPRLAIAFLLALAASAAAAQDTRSVQSEARDRASGDGLQPFLFDGRMPGDGSRQRAAGGEKHRNGGTVVMPRKASQPERER